MIVWNIIRFVCGLPPGEHRDWIMARIRSFNEFFTGPWYRNDWIWKFLSNRTNWLTVSQSVHLHQGEKTLKISWFAKMQFKNWIFFSNFSRLLANYTVWTFVYSLGTFRLRLAKKKLSHNLSMHIHAITKSEKDNFDESGAKPSDKHCNLWYDVLVKVSWYSLMVGNIHMWSGQKHRSKVVREEKKLMMIKCDSCYTAIILSSINFQIELSPA